MNREIPENSCERSSDKSSAGGIYYAKTADKYRIAKISFFVFLIVFIILTIAFGHSAMRGVHFQYLVKYLDINPMTLDSRYADISYAVGGGSKFALYHDDLAILGEGKMVLYDLSGDLKFRSDIKKGTASVDSDGKYLAAYVSGEKNLTFFHSFDKAEELSFPSPISFVVVSEEGTSAICLKENGGNAILILDDTFKTKQTISQIGGVVIDMAISDDGKTLSVATLFGSDGSFYTKLELWNLKKEELVKSETFSVRKPVATGFFTDDRFYLMLDRELCFYASDGDKLQAVSLPTDTFRCEKNGENLLIVSSSGELSLYESNGSKEFSISVTESILDMKLMQDRIYLLSENAIVLYDDKGNFLSRVNIASGALDFFVLDDESVLLCYVSETKRISFAE